MNFCPEKDDIQLQENKFVQFLKYDFKNDERFKTGLQRLIKCSSEKTSEQEYFKAKLFYYSKYFVPITFQEFMDWEKRKQNLEMPYLQGLNLESSSKSDVLLNGKTEDKENTLENSSIASVVKQSFRPVPDTDRQSITIKCDLHYSQSPVSFTQNCKESLASPVSSSQDFSESLTSPVSSAQNICESLTSECDIQNSQTVQNSNGLLTHPVSSVQNVDESLTNKTDTQRPASPVSCPQNFSELMEIIQSGKPVPGIIHIDVKPTNTLETPSAIHRVKKPWE
ncbi:uncharacterized protein LOC121375297 [Gigantopelta aegis]|uniref:uncharacterized protein LOC121375297 n=1 Tax=Gigantopelta aegis TaxID=1735272 RepID=UPI001B88B9CD|nr:uncharacterized protein LOC121375297 [Gigantopelta aegis]